MRNIAKFLGIWVCVLGLVSAAAVAQPVTNHWTSGNAASVVEAQAIWSQSQAHVGDQRTLALLLAIKEGFHLNPNQAQIDPAFDYLIPLELKIKTDHDESLVVGDAQFPKARDVTVRYTGEPAKLKAYQGHVVIFVPVIVKEKSSSGKIQFQISINYQACNDTTCMFPTSIKLNSEMEVVPLETDISATAGLFPPGIDKNIFAGFDSSVFATLSSEKNNTASASTVTGKKLPGASAVKLDFLGHAIAFDASGLTGTILILLVAMIAGVLLNFTPCVLPVIPLKVLALHQQDGTHGRARTLQLSAVFSLGIVGCFVVLGALVAGLVGGAQKFEWGQIFSIPAVSVGLGLIIAIMAMGMFELYEVKLPQRVYMFNPSHDTMLGNFLLGVLTAVLSTPCTGPMLGGTVAWAARQPAWLSLVTFSVMGVGMALPYAILTANPKWIDKLPRTGPASLLVKQVLGLLLLAVSLFFLGPILPGKSRWWLIALFVIVAMGWLLWRTFSISQKSARRGVIRVAVAIPALLMAVLVVLGARLLTSTGPIPWQEFSLEKLQAAQKEKKTILLEFTADWCGNCKALELSTYRDAKLAGLFDSSQYAAFQVDLTSQDNTQGWDLQRKFGSGGGIPLAVIFPNGSAEPTRVFQGLFGADQLVEALKNR